MRKTNIVPTDNQTKRLRVASFLILILSALLIGFVTVFMYRFTAQLLKDRLDQRVHAITSTAVLLIDGDEITELIAIGPEKAVKSQIYRKVVRNLQKIKQANENLTFAYILAPTKNLAEMVFVADADVIALRPSLNFDIDEVTEEGFPGYVYDVSDVKVIQDGSAFIRTEINPDIYVDEWGTLYTGYAPIHSKEGRTVALLALDIDISDYNNLVKATFMPFGLLTVLMMMTLAVLGISLLRMWGSRVDLLRDLDRQKDELLSIVSNQIARGGARRRHHGDGNQVRTRCGFAAPADRCRHFARGPGGHHKRTRCRRQRWSEGLRLRTGRAIPHCPPSADRRTGHGIDGGGRAGHGESQRRVSDLAACHQCHGDVRRRHARQAVRDGIAALY
jgi:hypothetical protein